MNYKTVTIIGAGPAGIATALQLKLYDVDFCILEKKEVGGLLWNADHVQNYPGFPGGIPGIRLVKLFKDQLEKASINIVHDKVENLVWENGVFQAVSKKNIYSSKVVVIASGTEPIIPTDIEITPTIGKKVFYEIAPLQHVKHKNIVVIGSGDAAFDYSLNLCGKNKIVLLNRGLKEKCLPVLLKEINLSNNVEYHKNVKINEIILDKSKDKLILKCVANGIAFSLKPDYVVFAIGRKPVCGFIPTKIQSQIKDLEIKGLIHFAGDVKNGIFRQTGIAVGDGIKAAMKIYNQFKDLNI